MSLLQEYEHSSFTRWNKVGYYSLSLIAYAILNLALGVFFRGSELALYPDASGHYISGMMFLDYVSVSPDANFFDHIAGFHEHYPFVAVGLWPPLFHVFEAGWMLLFSADRYSLLALDAFVAGAAGCLTASIALRLMPMQVAVTVGALVCLYPLFLSDASILKIDLFTGVLIFWAATLFIDFLDQPTLKRAVWVTAASVAALMSKGTAVALVLVFPIAVLFLWDFWILRDKYLWGIAAFTGILAGPWYVLTSASSSQGFRFEAGLDYSLTAIFFFAESIYQNIGTFGIILVVVACFSCWNIQDQQAKRMVRGMIACILGVLTFQIVMPVALQDRYIAAIFMPLAILAGFGSLRLFRSHYKLGAGLMAIYVGSVAYQAPIPVRETGEDMVKFWHGSVDETTTTPILLLTSPEVEGLIASEVLMEIPAKFRRNVTILRGVKLLGGGGYNNLDYVSKYQSEAEVLAAIKATGISMIFYEQSARSSTWLHNDQFSLILEQYPNLFETLQTFDLGQEREVRLISLRNNENREPDLELIWKTNSNNKYRSFRERFGSH